MEDQFTLSVADTPEVIGTEFMSPRGARMSTIGRPVTTEASEEIASPGVCFSSLSLISMRGTEYVAARHRTLHILIHRRQGFTTRDTTETV